MSRGDYRGGGYRSNVNRDRARERAPRQSGAPKGPKVLLFVQKRWDDGSWANEPKCRGEVRPSGAGDYWLSRIQKAVRDAADRWWLVECRDAEHGRGIIALGNHVDSLMGYKFSAAPCGRILAHGSRAPREAGKP